MKAMRGAKTMAERATARRIVVLLDASRTSLAALEAAIERAASERCELHALFVEEDSLLRSAGFSFAREVGAISGSSRPVDPAAMEARLRQRAESIQRALEQALDGRRVSYFLNVRRGNVLREALSLAGADDLLILGKVGWSAGPGRSLGSTARALARRAPGPVLLWSTMAPGGCEGAVMVLLDDFEKGRGALSAALDRARRQNRDLSILLVRTDNSNAAGARERAVAKWLADSGIQARLRRIDSQEPRAIARAVRQERGCELVFSRGSRLMQGAEADVLLELLPVPLTISA